jgi:hypothetical protein
MSDTGSRRKARWTVVLGSFAALAPFAAAQISQVGTISIGPPEGSRTLSDRHGYFEQRVLASTRSGDLLVFFARPDGNWELSRVRGWARSDAAVRHLTLPGYFSIAQRQDLDWLEAKLFVTSDDRYAVCVASAEWMKNVHGDAASQATSDSMISVVDLRSFTVANHARTKTLNLYQFQSVRMGEDGRLVIHSRAPGGERKAAFISLEIPSLRPGPRCDYESVPAGPGESGRPRALTSDTCSRALGSFTLEQYLREPGSTPVQRDFVCQDSRAGYCPQPESFTPDGRFALGVRIDGHDSLWGGWVQTEATAVVFSASTRAEIGEVDLMRGAPKWQWATQEGRDYLLVLRRGSELRAYALMDSAAGRTP